MNLRIAIFLFLFGISELLQSQNFNLTNERSFELLYINKLDTAVNFHSSIKPFNKTETDRIFDYDSTISTLNIGKEGSYINGVTSHYGYSINKKFKLFLNPIINLASTFENNDNGTNSVTEKSIGLSLKTAYSKKWSAEWDFLYDNSEYVSHIDALIKDKNISPGYGYSENGNSIFSQGNITFTADENFTFQAGYGKHFIGDGYRSLFLSDNANSYPYLKVTANIWKIKYMALYSVHNDIRFSSGNINDYQYKFAATHYLSLNATKWLNIGFFESIIFQAQEGNFYRGFELAYLNPIIFLRSVEFAQGSADNALLGGSIKMRILKKNIFYSQFLFDEFLLKELKENRGWWGNKFGIQAGIKMIDFLTVKNLRFQAEYNVVRPFTYSYFFQNTNTTSTLQNYGHFNAALAHPLGANFKELTLSLAYQKKRWIIEAFSTIAQVGFDTSAVSSLGQDIYRPYNTRTQEFGHTIAQGLTTDIINSTLKISFIVNPKSNLLLQAGVTNRNFSNNQENTNSTMIFVGLKTAITNRYFDF